MIYVIATIQVAEGKRDEFLKAFQVNVPNVLAEAGCIEYQPTVDLASEIAAQGDVRPDVVTVVEKWESLAALHAHLVAPHMVRFRESVKQISMGASLQVLEPA